jgi:hypothetical protein
VKAITSLVLLPVIVAAGACSSNKQSGAGSSTGPHGLSDAGDASGDDGPEEAGDRAAAGTAYEAAMSGANVSPTAGGPVLTSSTGDAKLTLESDMMTLDYDITLNVPNATSVNLHVGAPLEDGTVTHQLGPISQHMTGKVTLSSDEASALANDQLYVDVTSQANPGGEIRGQAVTPGSIMYVAVPTGAQEVPGVTSSYIAHASFILSPDGTSAVYHVVTTAVPTNVLLVRAIAPIIGTDVYALRPLGQTVDGMLTLQPGDRMDFAANHFYVNITTSQYQTGELRGQVIPPGATLFSGLLLGSNEVPPVSTQATGGAQFVLSADQTTLAYEIDVSDIVPKSADLDQGASGSDGTMLDSLTLDPTGALGTLMTPSNDLPPLQGGNNYVNVHTDGNPNGELRAQLVEQGQ